jgi:predicted TIM-barrel fold metal-dependent hydrolase
MTSPETIDKTDTTVFDAHVHIWEPDWLPATLRMSWAEHAAYRNPGPGRTPDEIYPRVSRDIVDPDARHLRTAMDVAGVAQALILGVDYGPAEWAATRTPARIVMEHYERVCRASDGRFFYAAGIHPHRADAAELARAYLHSDLCQGLKLYPPAGFRASDPECEPVYAALDEAGKTAIFHTAYNQGRLHWRNSWPVHISEVQARHPHLTIVLAHSGFPCWWDEAVAVAATHPRTYLEISLWQEDALAAPQDFLPRLERAVRLCGSDRIIFGSDTFYGPKQKGVDELKQWVQFFHALPQQTDGRITEHDVARMLHRNARDAFPGTRDTTWPPDSPERKTDARLDS